MARDGQISHDGLETSFSSYFHKQAVINRKRAQTDGPSSWGLENEQVTRRHMLRHACGYLPDNRQAPESYLLLLFGFAKEPSPDCSDSKHSPSPKLEQGLDK